MANNIETMIKEVDKYDDQIAELKASIADKVDALCAKRDEINNLLNFEITKQATEELKNEDYGCGTANIETDRYKVKVVVSKGVKWDEDILRKIAVQIREGGQDPEDFIKYKLSVSETDYKKFGDNIQAVFEPARTIQPSKPVIKIERK